MLRKINYLETREILARQREVRYLVVSICQCMQLKHTLQDYFDQDTRNVQVTRRVPPTSTIP